MPPKRGVIYLALTAALFVFMLVAFGTNVYCINNEAANIKQEVRTDIWYQCSRAWNTNGNKPVATCSDVADPQLQCTSAKDRVRSIRAFYIITALFIVANLVAGVLDFFGALKLPMGLKPQIVLVALSAIIIGFSLLSWAIAISWPRSKYCGANASVSEGSGFGWGASPFMMLVLMIIAIVQLVLTLVLPAGASDADDKSGGMSSGMSPS